jgi:hypothetical protein
MKHVLDDSQYARFLLQAQIKKEDAKKVAVQVDENVPAPSPRCNCTVSRPCPQPCALLWRQQARVYFSIDSLKELANELSSTVPFFCLRKISMTAD